MAKTINNLKKKLLCNPKIKMIAFNFPQGINNTTSLSDILEDSVDDKYFLSEASVKRLLNVGGGIKEQVSSTLFSSQHKISRGMTIIQENQPKHSNDRIYSEDGISPTINTAQGGNRQPFIRNPYNGKQSELESGTLGTSCGTTTGKTAQLLYNNMKIRRLTPTECERLMGLPDRWTAEGTEGKISDTQRYKLCGNGVVVNVVKEIIKKLCKKL